MASKVKNLRWEHNSAIFLKQYCCGIFVHTSTDILALLVKLNLNLVKLNERAVSVIGWMELAIDMLEDQGSQIAR